MVYGFASCMLLTCCCLLFVSFSVCHQICGVGDRDMSPVSQLTIAAPETGQAYHRPFSMWIVGWCTYLPYLCENTRSGYIMEYDDGECFASFDSKPIAEVWTKADANGLLFTYFDSDETAERRIAHLRVQCDEAMTPKQITQFSDVVDVIRYNDSTRNNKTTLNFTFEFKSKCACSNGCVVTPTPTRTPTATAILGPPSPCMAGKRDLSNLQPSFIIAPDSETKIQRVWAVNWCKQQESSELFQPCNGSSKGYMQIFDGVEESHRCQANLKHWEEMREVSRKSEHTGEVEGGVKICLAGEMLDGTRAVVHVNVWCDQDAPEDNSAISEIVSDVKVVTVSASQREYSLDFKSRCACENSCKSQYVIPEAIPSAEPLPSLPSEGPGHQASSGNCKNGDQRISLIQSHKFESTEHLPGMLATDYTYVMGWCNAIEDPHGVCEGLAFVHILEKVYKADNTIKYVCRASLNSWLKMALFKEGTEIYVSGSSKSNDNLKIVASVRINCANTNDMLAHTYEESVFVEMESPSLAYYTFVFSSLCACPGGCPYSPKGNDQYLWALVIVVFFAAICCAYVGGGIVLSLFLGRRGRAVFSHILCLCQIPALLKGNSLAAFRDNQFNLNNIATHQTLRSGRIGLMDENDQFSDEEHL